MHGIVKTFCVTTLFLIVATIGLVALSTYHADDATIFYQSSEVTTIRNFLGSFGAQTAGFLFFYWGYVSWLLVLSMVWLAYISYSNSLRQGIDWYGALGCCIVSSSYLMHYMILTTHDHYMPGGYCGYMLWHFFTARFPEGIALIIVSGIWLSSLIVITRLQCLHPLFLLLERIKQPRVWLLHILARCKRLILPVQKIFNSMVSELSLEHVVYQEYYDEIVTSSPSSVSPVVSPEVSSNQSSGSQTGVPEEDLENNVPEIHAKPYILPSAQSLSQPTHESYEDDYQISNRQAKVLEQKLERFGIFGTVTTIKHGPVITLFEYQPHIDTKLSKIVALEDDLALALEALSIRIIAPIPGRSVVGFEIANKHRKSVFFSSIIKSKEWKKSSALIPLVIGNDTVGNSVIVDLASMPHILIAGSTGSGKSVALNAMVMSLLCRFNPDELKIILIDPKKLEFIQFRDIAHLLLPIITEPKNVVPALRWLVQTMQERYEYMALHNVRNVADYHQLYATNKSLQAMPYIVVIIDELADLMMCAGKDVEDLIARISQMARAAGIHLIVATQRPSVDVITGVIKVNFPCRISFKVISKIDSRTILDCIGADKLLGKGDMLWLDATGQLHRAHGAYVSDHDINTVVGVCKQQAPTYITLEHIDQQNDEMGQEDQQLLVQVIDFIRTIDEVSISLLQRKFRIGYNRSARIIELLEAQGLIMPNTGGKTRKVIH